MIKVEYTDQYQRMLQQLIENEEDVDLIDRKIMLFQRNPHDTRLRDHALTKRLTGKWAFSITDDIRIVYEWLGETTVRFLAIGKHKEVYNKHKN